MQTIQTKLDGLVVVHANPYIDNRGTFSKIFSIAEFSELLGNRQIAQVNYSKNYLVGSIRGLHYQNFPYKEIKLVTCLRGAVWDVVVDLRRDSPTFLEWHAEVLTSETFKTIIIPEGFGHGFQVLEANSELLYLHTNVYMPIAEAGIRYDDPRIAISWPAKVTNISVRDKSHPYLADNFFGI